MCSEPAPVFLVGPLEILDRPRNLGTNENGIVVNTPPAMNNFLCIWLECHQNHPFVQAVYVMPAGDDPDVVCVLATWGRIDARGNGISPRHRRLGLS